MPRSRKSKVKNNMQTECGFDCTKKNISQDQKEYHQSRKTIPVASMGVVDNVINRTRHGSICNASVYKEMNVGRLINTLDTSGLYKSNIVVQNPNAKSKLAYGGEDYADMIEREYYTEKIHGLVGPMLN